MFTFEVPQGLLRGYLTIHQEIYWESETLARYLNVDPPSFHQRHHPHLHPLPEVLAATQNYFPDQRHHQLMVHITFLEVLWWSEQPHAVQLCRHFLKGDVYIRPLDASRVRLSSQYSPSVTLFMTWVGQYCETWIQRKIFQEFPTCSPASLGSPFPAAATSPLFSDADSSPYGPPDTAAATSPVKDLDPPLSPLFCSHDADSSPYGPPDTAAATSLDSSPEDPLTGYTLGSSASSVDNSPLSFTCYSKPPCSPPPSSMDSASWDRFERLGFLLSPNPFALE